LIGLLVFAILFLPFSSAASERFGSRAIGGNCFHGGSFSL
jgi:hypothetical protein